MRNPARRRIAAEELHEDPLLLVLRDPEALVADAHADNTVLLLGDDVHRASLGGVLDRVRQEVADHLREAVRIPRTVSGVGGITMSS